MSKYIVKNCPCIDTTGAYSIFNCECLNRGYKEQWRCYDKDCLIKQVIEKMKEHPFGDCSCGDEILQLFEIEECEQ